MSKHTDIKKEQKRITALVTEKFPHYYLTGGTALAFHLDHRFSEDLDFFSRKYTSAEADKIMDFIASETGHSFQLDSEEDQPGLVPMKVFFLELQNKVFLKIDLFRILLKILKMSKMGFIPWRIYITEKFTRRPEAERKKGRRDRLLPLDGRV